MKRNVTFAIDEDLLKRFDEVIKRKSTGTSRIIKSAIVEQSIKEFIEKEGK